MNNHPEVVDKFVQGVLSPRQQELLDKFLTFSAAYTKEHIEAMGFDFGDAFFESSIATLMDPDPAYHDKLPYGRAFAEVVSGFGMVLAILEEEGSNIDKIYASYKAQMAVFKGD